jgi:hypothetical protein
LTAFGNHESHSGFVEVGDQLAVGVLDHGSNWNRENYVFTGCSIAEVTGSLSAIATLLVRAEVVFEQSGYVWVGDQADRTAVTTISAIWAS